MKLSNQNFDQEHLMRILQTIQPSSFKMADLNI